MTPRISVVIPSYNHERFIAQTIQSVLDQSVDDLELVIVDDGSKDRTPEVVRETFARYPNRKTSLIEQENKGAHAAIMRGISASNGSIIAILNSDDYYSPNRLERVLPLFKGQRYAFAFTKVALVNEAGEPLPDDHAWPQWYETALSALENQPTVGFALFEQNFSVTSGNFAFTRALYDVLEGFSAHRFLHDWDFLIRATFYTEPLFVPEELMCYRIHGSNTTESVRPLLAQEAADALSRYRELCSRGAPPNKLAPHPCNWPYYFELFSHATPTFFDSRAIATHLRI